MAIEQVPEWQRRSAFDQGALGRVPAGEPKRESVDELQQLRRAGAAFAPAIACGRITAEHAYGVSVLRLQQVRSVKRAAGGGDQLDEAEVDLAIADVADDDVADQDEADADEADIDEADLDDADEDEASRA